LSKLRMKISMSLDGYVAGPDQSVENPLFDGVHELRGLELVRTVAAPGVTHLKLARR
jgi:hypothetical protein